MKSLIHLNLVPADKHSISANRSEFSGRNEEARKVINDQILKFPKCLATVESAKKEAFMAHMPTDYDAESEATHYDIQDAVAKLKALQQQAAGLYDNPLLSNAVAAQTAFMLAASKYIDAVTAFSNTSSD